MLDKLFNPVPTIYKWDRFWVGFFPGLVFPLLAIPFFYVLQHDSYTVSEYLKYVKNPRILSPLLSFGIIINLILFFPLIWINYGNAARGVIGAVILYSIPILVTKFLL